MSGRRHFERGQRGRGGAAAAPSAILVRGKRGGLWEVRHLGLGQKGAEEEEVVKKEKSG